MRIQRNKLTALNAVALLVQRHILLTRKQVSAKGVVASVLNSEAEYISLKDGVEISKFSGRTKRRLYV